MPWFNNAEDVVISFADETDVQLIDQRLFEANNGLTDEIVTDFCIRETARILTKISATDEWVNYYLSRSSGTAAVDIPDVNPNLIISSTDDFTDLCVYGALYEYILPRTANFGLEEDSTYAKIDYYHNKFNGLFGDLIKRWDWYDFDGDGTVDSNEKFQGIDLYDTVRMVRIR